MVIGLATRIMAQKKFFRSRFDNKSELKDEMERLFNATDIYSIYEDEDVIVFNLKPDVAKKEILLRERLAGFRLAQGLFVDITT